MLIILNRIKNCLSISIRNLLRNFIPERSCSSDQTPSAYNRHNYDKKIEKLINYQINVEFCAGYTYLNIASYFDRSDIALPGCYGYFMKMFHEEQVHALEFIKYQNLRGGRVKFTSILALERNEWNDLINCFDCSLALEKSVKEKLVDIYKTADNVGDTNVMDMLDPIIYQQERSIYELSRLFTRANELTTNNIGRYLFDRELHETHVKSDTTKCTMDFGNKLYT